MRRRAGVRLPARSRRVHFCAIGPCNADTPALIAASWAYDPARFDRRVHPREERLLGTGRQAAPAGGDGGERTGSAVELRLLAWRRRAGLGASGAGAAAARRQASRAARAGGEDRREERGGAARGRPEPPRRDAALSLPPPAPPPQTNPTLDARPGPPARQARDKPRV